MHVLIVGVGRMGSQIGCEFAAAGHEVTCLARSVDTIERNVELALDVATRHGLLGARSQDDLRERIHVATELAAVEPPAQLVLESLPEVPALKVEFLSAAAARWPEAIIASNTSSLSITTIGEAIGAPERTIGLHYWNPPLLMPLVEVIATGATDPAVRATALDWISGVGKQPVLVERDVPGFIWNRLQFALLREALWLVENGVAEPATVDLVVRDGLARRLSLTGPFESAELGGLETFAAVAQNLFPELSAAVAAPGLREWTPRDQGELDALAARRDACLAQQLAASA
jgi:3-hydroxybutyryl-CoA dehydrogenase